MTFICLHGGNVKIHSKRMRYECERFYKNVNQYYHSLRRLGPEYKSLNYAEAFPFSQLLLKSLTL